MPIHHMRRYLMEITIHIVRQLCCSPAGDFCLQSKTGNLYNLYGDRELSLNLVPQSVYDMQSAYYPTVNRRYGVPLDTRNNFVKSKY